MKLQLFHVDAFTDTMFGGNSACVVPLDAWLPDAMMFKIARENAVAETAFFVPKNDRFHIRWFTPEIEMDLCGHATIATAHVLKTHLHHPNDKVIYDSNSGKLETIRTGDMYSINFPTRKPVPAELPEVIQRSLSKQPKAVLKDRDYILVYETESDIRTIKINRTLLDQINLDPGGVVVTSQGEACDFVSRFFTPQATIFEDPVTGSAHCSLIPYWSERLNKKQLTAMQISDRLGKLSCVLDGDRVLISGKAKTYLVGTIFTE